jgi:6-pyruvoyltetrahydropterin/6-carboxytetrahydropterin synthase
MFEISRERTFSSAHQLRGYKGACERLHGHNWKIRVHLFAAELDDQGMVIDFRELDRMMREALAPFDHQLLNDVQPFDKINPSAENLAAVIAQRVMEQISDSRVELRCCDVWEAEYSRARYYPDK